MIENSKNKFLIKGASGKEYRFNRYKLENFEGLKSAFRAISAVYFSTIRAWNGQNYIHTRVYCGETGNLSTRFDNHHAETCFRRQKANCTSIMSVEDEKEGKQIEKDISANNHFPCNIQHQ